MLDTHSAQTESGLLDSNDHYIPFLYDIEWYVVIHVTNTLFDKINLNNFTLWICPLLKEKSDLFCKVEKNEIWLTKNQICFVKDKKGKKEKKKDLVNKNQICFVKDKKKDLVNKNRIFFVKDKKIQFG